MRQFFSKLCVTSFVALILCVTAALAQAPATPPAAEEPPKQIQLNADVVQRFIDTFKDMKEMQKSLEAKSGKKNAAEEEKSDADFTANTPEAMAKMQTILKKHGFENPEQWGETAQSVMLAYGYADPESGLSDLDTNIKKSIDDIKKDTNLSEDERKEAIKNLETEYQNVSRMKPLPGNVDTVKPFLPQIKSVVESE